MKKIAFILFAIAYGFAAFSQHDVWNQEKQKWEVDTSVTKYSSNKARIFSEAQFIFEGTVIKQESYKAGGMITTANIVQITKVFRGADKIKLGTIEIITKGGSVGETVETYEAVIVEGGGTSANIASNGIYFCTPSTFSSSNIPADNSIRVVAMAEIKYDFMSGHSSGFGKQFNNKLEVFNFLGEHKNITVPSKSDIKNIVIEEVQAPIPDDIIGAAKSYIISKVGVEFYKNYISYDDKPSRNAYKYRGMVMFNIKVSETPLVYRVIPIQIKDRSKGIVDSVFTPVDKEELSTCVIKSDQCTLPMDRISAIEIANAEGFEQGAKGWEMNLVVWADVKGDYRWSISNTLEGYEGAHSARGNSIVINAITGAVKHGLWSRQE